VLKHALEIRGIEFAMTGDGIKWGKE
jgi:hypothetical protein